MFDYRELSLEDKSFVDEIVISSGVVSSDYPFVNNFLWKDYFEINIIDSESFYCLFYNKTGAYLFPLLKDPLKNRKERLKTIIDRLKLDAEEKNTRLKFYGMTKEMKEELEELFPGEFKYSSLEKFSDYIYKIEDLVNLKGKKYHSKRNFINSFKQQYPDWKYQVLSKPLFEDCLKMDEDWLKQKGDHSGFLSYEVKMLQTALLYFEELDLIGGVIRVNDKVAGFSLGYKINDKIIDNVIEKASTEYKGIYSILCQQFLDHIGKSFIYVNREEDLGLANLKKAKLSLHPCEVLDKYEAARV